MYVFSIVGLMGELSEVGFCIWHSGRLCEHQRPVWSASSPTTFLLSIQDGTAFPDRGPTLRWHPRISSHEATAGRAFSKCLLPYPAG